MLPEQRRASACACTCPFTTSPAGRKKLVPAERSSSNSTPPASNTPNASRIEIAVTNHAHTVSGMRISVIPGARKSIVVAMKFTAPRSDATQKIKMLTIHSVCPIPSPGPGLRPARSAADRPSIR